MCGIAGYLSSSVPASEALAKSMADRIVHRGPDSGGAWCDKDAGIALSHRRLAIIDLSEAGHQPMVSKDGRYVLSYNGEIYNHREIRKELEKLDHSSDWKGHSDTETLLEALQHWGLEACLKRLNGMFAFALWDRKLRTLSLARDRMGEKPLYYGRIGQSIVFGSELKAIRVHPEWTGKLNYEAVSAFLRFAYVPDPMSIFEGVYKLPPAHFIQLKIDQTEVTSPISYWSLADVTQQTERRNDTPELITETETQLSKAIGLRMDADVPVGAFLSGGIDSSVVVALMQQHANQSVQSFTIGFDVPGYNEAESAKAVARHLGTNHTELYLTPKDTLDLVPKLPEIWDEPFADSSQIPTHLLSKMTRDSVTVALSGDGGDEFFGGYNRYGQGYDQYQALLKLPAPVRQVISSVLRAIPNRQLDKAMNYLPASIRQPAMGSRLHKLAAVIGSKDGASFYKTLVSQIQHPNQYMLSVEEPKTIVDKISDWPSFEDFRECMMYLDAVTYLPGDILTKVDRASMAVSLETRVPFLDHNLIEYSWSLPMSAKIRNGETKWILREILARHLPREIFERPKMGFGIPIEHWLGGPLKNWAAELLSPDRIKKDGIFDPEPIAALWQRHLSGKGEEYYRLWTLLMFQSWLGEMQKW